MTDDYYQQTRSQNTEQGSSVNSQKDTGCPFEGECRRSAGPAYITGQTAPGVTDILLQVGPWQYYIAGNINILSAGIYCYRILAYFNRKLSDISFIIIIY